MNQLNRVLCMVSLLVIGIVYLPGGHARMGDGGWGGGGMGGRSIFDGFPTEEQCRDCHEDLVRFPQLELANPDRHHRLIGTPIPDPGQSKAPDAPGGTPGEPYECLACHRSVWDDSVVAYVFNPFRDCLQCHPASVVTGRDRKSVV